jgi:hypothetical protein
MAIAFVSTPNPSGASGRTKLMDGYLLASEAASRCARLGCRP